MKKYLFIGIADQPLLEGLALNIKKKEPNCKIDVISVTPLKNLRDIYDNVYLFPFYNWYYKNIKRGSHWIFSILLFFWCIPRRQKYDVVELHYLWLFHNHIFCCYKRIGKKVIGVLWGSDIFRLSVKSYPSMKKLLLRCDKINCITEKMISKINEISNGEINNEKIVQARFGLEHLNDIDNLRNASYSKYKLADILNIKDIERYSLIVTVGSNGSEGQQHLKILHLLSEIRNKSTLFLLPVTYGGNENYISQLISVSEGLNIPVIFFTNFLSSNKIAALRLITDIFIQLQITDNLSAAMLEHLYAGNIVITGKWLQYNILQENGVNIETIENVDQIADKLNDCICNYNLYKNKQKINSEAIYKLASWEECIEKWIQL